MLAAPPCGDMNEITGPPTDRLRIDRPRLRGTHTKDRRRQDGRILVRPYLCPMNFAARVSAELECVEGVGELEDLP